MDHLLKNAADFNDWGKYPREAGFQVEEHATRAPVKQADSTPPQPACKPKRTLVETRPPTRLTERAL